MAGRAVADGLDKYVRHALPTIDSIIEAARHNLTSELWDYCAGGAESEATLRRNRSAFDRIGFRPRLLKDVRGRSTTTKFLGRELSLPVMLAPVGSIGQYHPDGALAVARVAERAGTAAFIATMALPPVDEVSPTTQAPLVFQLYIRGDRAWVQERVRRAEAAGCIAICLTADVVVRGRRERNLNNRFTAMPPNEAESFQEAFTWRDFDWLRTITKLPLMLKGVMCEEDAELAVEHGADVVYVSNHGGRQIDHLPGTLDVLPEVVAGVAGRADVLVDGGFVRGTDVLKAISLGARAVLIGKLMIWGLAAAGEAGADLVLDMLREEILTSMANLGVRDIHELGPDLVRPVLPAPSSDWIGFAPHETDPRPTT